MLRKLRATDHGLDFLSTSNLTHGQYKTCWNVE